jgi:hypothetical protein
LFKVDVEVEVRFRLELGSGESIFDSFEAIAVLFNSENRVDDRLFPPEMEVAGVTKVLVIGVSKSAVPLRVEETLGEVKPEEGLGWFTGTTTPTNRSGTTGLMSFEPDD